MIYLTGDTHGSFSRLEAFCSERHTSKEDLLIILGDAGFNFSGGLRDHDKKRFVSALPVTVLCIHGNHEQRPDRIPSYSEAEWRGGTVWREEMYPDILFARDGEIYNLNGKRAAVIGGAYSVDWMYRTYGRSWWPDEQPSPSVREHVEEQLEKQGWQVDYMLTHTCPLRYEPTEVFIPGLDQSTVDKSTEEWLGQIEQKLTYEKWFCGHFHTEKKIDRLEFMYNNYAVLE
ncbi:MAG: metallophosphoesterase [Clostridia bacterium]|nr:metallophosphoesterase [Clostridia bacterium]